MKKSFSINSKKKKNVSYIELLLCSMKYRERRSTMSHIELLLSNMKYREKRKEKGERKKEKKPVPINFEI